MPRFKKGSAQAKAYMAKLRSMVGKRRTPIKKFIRVPHRIRSVRRHISLPRRKRYHSRRRSYSPGRYFRRVRHGKQPMPLLPVIGIAAPLIDSFQRAGGVDGLTGNPSEFVSGFIDQVAQHFTGQSPIYHTGTNAYLGGTYGGIIAGFIGHMAMQKLGVNRYMKRIPLVGKYIQL